MYSHDVVIVGSGLAGLRAAMELVGHLDVAVLTKVYPSRSHSGAAQGGVAAALTRELHSPQASWPARRALRAALPYVAPYVFAFEGSGHDGLTLQGVAAILAGLGLCVPQLDLLLRQPFGSVELRDGALGLCEEIDTQAAGLPSCATGAD